ncbi:MAG: aminopeptidase P family protein [Pseudoflavonifractor sp.]
MNHLKKIAAKLPDYGLDAMLITSEPGEFYAIGFHGEGVALVTQEGNYYFTDARYIEACRNRVSDCAIAAPEDRSYREEVKDLVEKHGIQRLGFEDGSMSVRAHSAWTQTVSATLVPANALLDELRIAKDQEEIRRMIQAQRISERAFEEILTFIKPGATEKEIAARLEYDMLRFGAEKMSFDPIVASGSNGSMPHAIPGDKQVRNGEFITMDFGCKFGGYCSDMTRTIALGEPTEEMRKVYGIVLDAQLAGIAAAKANAFGCEVDGAARKLIADAGYGAYFGHGLGHSLGIEIHEDPRFSTAWKELIEAGAVLSVEPGIYLPGRFGVRIEDVVILTEGGCQVITKSPKQLIVL